MSNIVFSRSVNHRLIALARSATAHRQVALGRALARPATAHRLIALGRFSSTSASLPPRSSSPIRAAMQEAARDLKFDQHQEVALDHFESLRNSLTSSDDVRKSIRGLYVYGGTGCGKTLMMNSFHSSLESGVKSQNIHFSTFLAGVNRRLHDYQTDREKKIKEGTLKRFLPKIHEDIGGTADSSTESSVSFFGIKIVLNSGDGFYKSFDKDSEDPIPIIAKGIAKETRLLCLDEVEVTDVADAFLVAKLLKSLFEEDIVIVCTSNNPPENLYKEGLNREVFLPVIAEIEKNTVVVSMEDSSTDYRLLKSTRRPPQGGGEDFIQTLYSGDSARELFDKAFQANVERSMHKGWKATSSVVSKGTRAISIPLSCKKSRTCKFDFKELCGADFGNKEFEMIFEEYDTVFLGGIKNFNSGGATVDQLRRFILFIDRAYMEKKLVIFETSHGLHKLWEPRLGISSTNSTNKLGDIIGTAEFVPIDSFTTFALDRCISRMLEMTSIDWDASKK